MAVTLDFTLERRAAGTLNISMTPPTNLGGHDVRFVLWRRENHASGYVSGLVLKSMASGYGNGVSGIMLVNSGTGEFNVSLAPGDFSGHFEPGLFAFKVVRMTSGQEAVLTEGFRLCP